MWQDTKISHSKQELFRTQEIKMKNVRKTLMLKKVFYQELFQRDMFEFLYCTIISEKDRARGCVHKALFQIQKNSNEILFQRETEDVRMCDVLCGKDKCLSRLTHPPPSLHPSLTSHIVTDPHHHHHAMTWKIRQLLHKCDTAWPKGRVGSRQGCSHQGLGWAKPSKASITTHDFPITNSEEDQRSCSSSHLCDYFPCKYYHIFTALSFHCDLVGTNCLQGYYHNTPFTNSGFTGLQLHCLYLHPTTMRMGWDMSIENISLSDLIRREREMAQSLSKVG